MSNDGELAVVEETAAAAPISSFDIVDVEAAQEFMNNYQDLVNALLDDSDYQEINGNNKKKKSAWRKLATAFNISDDVVNEESVFDETGQIVSSKFYVRATLPNGRSCIGVGSCSIYDKIRYKDTKLYVKDTDTPSNFILRGRFSNAEHDVPATAHTRAKNRAIADLIGAGEVTAEELDEVHEIGKSGPSKKRRASRTSTPNDKPAEKKPAKKRGRRKAPAKEEVIEAKAEVVEESDEDSSKSKYHAIDNQYIKKAINRIEERDDGVEITQNNIIDELFDLYDSGEINEDQYGEAKTALGM